MPLIEDVVAVVHEAGKIIEDVRASARLEVGDKGTQGPVTEADRRADDLLRRELVKVESAAWLSEETTDDHARLAARRVWVVDPLDGTKEFIAGIPEYAIAVGLVDRGEVVLGVTHNPASGDTVIAERGTGAWLNGRRVVVAESALLLASRSEMTRGEFAPFQDRTWDIRSIGSIALKLALVAAGRAAATLSRGPKWEWDVCAGSLIVIEAGGVVTDMFGDRLTFNRPNPKCAGILAGAPTAHARALERLRTVGASDRMAEFKPHA
jgi:myo-inositol-1(or 4)-monophosphatase